MKSLEYLVPVKLALMDDAGDSSGSVAMLMVMVVMVVDGCLRGRLVWQKHKGAQFFF